MVMQLGHSPTVYVEFNTHLRAALLLYIMIIIIIIIIMIIIIMLFIIQYITQPLPGAELIPL